MPIVAGAVLFGLTILSLVPLLLPGELDPTGPSYHRFGPLGGTAIFPFVLLIVRFSARVASGAHGSAPTAGPGRGIAANSEQTGP
ncbi:MAG: hypothetical protein WA761_01090 [Thermoplasmata archaeon]